MSPHGAIRMPTMQSGTSFSDMVEVAQLAERGKFDFLFLADTAAVNLDGSADARGRMGKVVKFEPMTILSALAAVTKHLGFVATSTTTFNEPYTLARQFASLDQISGGRSALEPRHLEQRAGCAELQPRRAHVAMPTGTSGRSSSPRSCSACGTAGTRTPSSATRSRVSSTTRRRCMC